MERAIKAVPSTVYCSAGIAVWFFCSHPGSERDRKGHLGILPLPLDLSSNALLGDGVEKSVEEMKVNGKQHTKSALFCQRWIVSH